MEKNKKPLSLLRLSIYWVLGLSAFGTVLSGAALQVSSVVAAKNPSLAASLFQKRDLPKSATQEKTPTGNKFVLLRSKDWSLSLTPAEYLMASSVMSLSLK